MDDRDVSWRLGWGGGKCFAHNQIGRGQKKKKKKEIWKRKFSEQCLIKMEIGKMIGEGSRKSNMKK